MILHVLKIVLNTNDLIHLDKDVGHMYIYSKYDMNVVIDL